MTPDQMDAVYEAQEEEDSLAELTLPQAALALAERGHPLFKGYAQAELPPAAPHARAARQEPPAAAPAAEVPEMDTGAPAELATVPAEEARQLPAAPDRRRQLPAAPAARALPQTLEEALAPGAGLEEFDQSDLAIPTLKIRQGMTQGADDVAVGLIYLESDHASASDSRVISLLSYRKERSLMLPMEGGEAEDMLCTRIRTQTGVSVPDGWKGPVCASRDRVLPIVQEGIKPLARTCAECPMGRWRTIRGKNTQDCRESYRVSLYDHTSELPVRFYARGKAIRPMRGLLTSLQIAARRASAPACAFEVPMSTKTEGGQDPYYVPSFGAPVLITDRARVEALAAVNLACLAADQAADASGGEE